MKQPSDNPKSSSERANDSGMDRLIDSFNDVYFQRMDKPLEWPTRFLSAFAGSFTYLFGAYYIFFPQFALLDQNTEPNITGSGSALLGNYDNIVQITWAFILTFVYALVASAIPVRHGPVRFYLTGLFIPFISIVMIRTALSVPL